MSRHDQTFLTDTQIKKDIERRHAIQRVGIELEMYSTKSINSTHVRIENELKFENWECVEDHSLYSFVEEVPASTRPINKKLDELLADPIKFAYEFNGHNLQYIYDNFKHIDPELTTGLENGSTSPNDFFQSLRNNPTARQFAIDLLSPRLDQYSVFEYTRIERKGVEARLASPISFNSVDYKLKEMVTIANDPVLMPMFHNPENGNSDNPEMSGENHGMAGLHFHFGLSQQNNYSVLDLFRLLKHAKEREVEIEKYAMRAHNRWCKKMDDIIEHVNGAICALKSSKIVDVPTNWFKDSGRFSLGDPRYYGVNVTNIGYGNRNNGRKKFNTVEFRWGSSKVVKSYDTLKAYFDFLSNLIDTSFTGARTMKWLGGYTLIDISDGYRATVDAQNTVAVISPEGKLMGRMTIPTLCSSFTKKLPSKVEEFVNQYKRTTTADTFVPLFDGVINKAVLERVKDTRITKKHKKLVWQHVRNTDNKNAVLKEFRKNSLGNNYFQTRNQLAMTASSISDRLLTNNREYDYMREQLLANQNHIGALNIQSTANLILGLR